MNNQRGTLLRGILLLAMLGWLALPGLAKDKITMFGISVGMDQTSIKNKLGIPRMEHKRDHSWGYRNVKGAIEEREDPVLFFDQNNRVLWMAASRFELNNKVIGHSNTSIEEVTKVLGAPSGISHERNADVYSYKKYDLQIIVQAKSKKIVVFAVGRSALNNSK